MRLLLFTQIVDREDPGFSFFHDWLLAVSKHFTKITVVCLKKGEYALPANISVLSLGKEEGKGRGTYVMRFFKYVCMYRREYDAVFVHMNQEYVLMGGLFWKMLRKPVYMWRNHYAGSFLTDIAAALCRKVFCTSKHSYTAKYAKVVLMPVGVDAEVFSPDAVPRKARSVLVLGRMARSKRPHLVLEALGALNKNGVPYTAQLVGNPPSEDALYYQELVQNAQTDHLPVTFTAGIPNRETVALYRTHTVFINASPSGMYDKTLFEAALCGSLVLASSADWRDFCGDERLFFTNALDLEAKLQGLLSLEEAQRALLSAQLRTLVEQHHSLALLGARLAEEIHE